MDVETRNALSAIPTPLSAGNVIGSATYIDADVGRVARRDLRFMQPMRSDHAIEGLSCRIVLNIPSSAGPIAMVAIMLGTPQRSHEGSTINEVGHAAIKPMSLSPAGSTRDGRRDVQVNRVAAEVGNEEKSLCGCIPRTARTSDIGATLCLVDECASDDGVACRADMAVPTSSAIPRERSGNGDARSAVSMHFPRQKAVAQRWLTEVPA